MFDTDRYYAVYRIDLKRREKDMELIKTRFKLNHGKEPEILFVGPLIINGQTYIKEDEVYIPL